MPSTSIIEREESKRGPAESLGHSSLSIGFGGCEVLERERKFMGRIQDSNGAKMSGKQRVQSDGSDAYTSSKKRRHEKNSKETSHAGGGEPTPVKDRRSWSQIEELELLKVLLEHKREGRVIPMQSKAAPYWSELIQILYPGEKGITQRRLYDKVRRMQQKYNNGDHMMQEGKITWKNAHEKTLYDFFEKIFGEDVHGTKAVKVPDGNPVKIVQVSASSSEEVEEDDQEEEEEIPMGKPTLRAQPSFGSEDDEEEEDEDEEDEDEHSSQEKRPPLHGGQSSARADGSRIRHEEPRRVNSVSGGENHRGVKASSKQFSGSGRKDMFVVKDRFNDAENLVVKKQRGRGGEQSLADADFVKSLKAELFEYVQKLRDDCMRELDDVKSQVMSPARLQMARRRQELFLEELALQEKELEISRRYCRLQKEALQFQSGN